MGSAVVLDVAAGSAGITGVVELSLVVVVFDPSAVPVEVPVEVVVSVVPAVES